jgi:uncharacterized membrane protein
VSEKPKRPKQQQVLPPAPKQDENTQTITQIKAQISSFSGPLPPPNILAQYNEIIPNGADRILAMAERQSAHRESMESQVVKENLAAQRRGSWFAFILALSAILGGVILIYFGKNASGLAAIITALASLAGVFFYSKYEQRKERVQKATALEARRKK